jgi:hypothetical protein
MAIMRTRLVCGAVAGALAGVVLAGCGGDGNGGATPTGSPPAAATSPTATGTPVPRVTVTMTEFRLAPSLSAFKPGRYLLEVKNAGIRDHALKLEGPGGEWQTLTVGPGRSATLDVTLGNGRYEMECPVGDHDDRGMKLKFTVGTAPASPASPQETESEADTEGGY